MPSGGSSGGLVVRCAAAALAATILAGCGGSADEVDSAPPTTSATAPSATAATSSTSAPARDREGDVVAGYRAHWDAWYAAALDADPELPAIAATTTGSFLERTRAEIAAMRSSGERVKGDPGVPPIDSRRARVVQFQSETTAVISDCYIDNTVRYDAAGKPVGGTEPTFFSATATLVVVDGTWKVASMQLKKDGCRA